MPNIYEVAERHRAALLKQERAAATTMIQQYQQAYTAIQAALNDLQKKMQDAETNGQDITPGWLFDRDRLQSFLRQCVVELSRFAQMASGTITEEQRKAVAAAPRDLVEQLNASDLPEILTSFTKLPTGAINELAGFMADGSPLSERFAQIAPTGAEAIKEAIVRSVTLGHNPRQTARAVRDAAAIPLSQALTISRTETLRAYREASRQSYLANSDAIKGWRWLASLTARTCPMCLAMSGTLHPLSEPFGSHPNCRCCSVPETKTYREMGIDIDEPERPKIKSGEDWLREQSQETQDTVLGKAGATAWRGGRVTLRDFVGERHDKQWGLIRFTLPQKEIFPYDASARKASGGGSGSDRSGSGSSKKQNASMATGQDPAKVLQLDKDLSWLKDTIQSIRSVHGFSPSILPVPVIIDPALARNEFGKFRLDGNGWIEIAIGQHAPPLEVPATFVHEVGHLSDAITAGFRGYGSDNKEDFKGFRDAVDASQSITTLHSLVGVDSIIPSAAFYGGKHFPISQNQVQYLLKRHEIFARAYAQYITLRSGDENLNNWLSSERGSSLHSVYPVQWDDADFEPIAQAMDELFKGLKWQK